MTCLEIWVRSHSRSLKMASFNTPHYTISTGVPWPYFVSFPR